MLILSLSRKNMIRIEVEGGEPILIGLPDSAMGHAQIMIHAPGRSISRRRRDRDRGKTLAMQDAGHHLPRASARWPSGGGPS